MFSLFAVLLLLSSFFFSVIRTLTTLTIQSLFGALLRQLCFGGRQLTNSPRHEI